MIQLKKKEFAVIVNKLKRKFEIKEKHTGHWQIKIFLNRKFIGHTKCSEGKGDIPAIIVQKIRKQLNFANDEEFTNFKNCFLSCEEYIKLLKQRNII